MKRLHIAIPIILLLVLSTRLLAQDSAEVTSAAEQEAHVPLSFTRTVSPSTSTNSMSPPSFFNDGLISRSNAA